MTCNPRSLSTPGGGWIPIKENLRKHGDGSPGVQEALGEFTSLHIMTAGSQYLHPHLLHSGYALDWCGLRFRIYLSPVILFKLRFSILSRKQHPKEATFSNFNAAHSNTQLQLAHDVPIQKSQDMATLQRFPVPQYASHLNDSIPPAAWEAQGTAMQISKAFFLKAEADHRDTQRIVPNHLL